MVFKVPFGKFNNMIMDVFFIRGCCTNKHTVAGKMAAVALIE